MNCHKKCEKLTANLCGVNQKLIVEVIESMARRNTLNKSTGFVGKAEYQNIFIARSNLGRDFVLVFIYFLQY